MRDELIYAVVYTKSTRIPGDERSRTNPGHGYPAYTQEDQIFKEFKNKEEWEKWITREEQRASPSEYRAFVCDSITISREIKINIDR